MTSRARLLAPKTIRDIGQLRPVCWFAADRISGLADAAAVATWSDASGNGNDATQATSGKRPVYKTGILNGLPVVRFTAANQHRLATAAFAAALLPPSTLVVVGKVTTIATTYNLTDGIAVGNRHVIQSANTGTYVESAGVAFNGVANDTSPHVHVGAFAAGGAAYLRTDGKIGGVGSTTHTLTGLTIGGRYDGTVVFLDGDIAEVAVINRLLSASELAALERHLAKKWGLLLA